VHEALGAKRLLKIRMALVWAQEQGLIDAAPVPDLKPKKAKPVAKAPPKKTSSKKRGRKRKNEASVHVAESA
jgi:hypothetical protein